jgi:thiamine pyrophosphate-dependent acetolactate synthase large subunit-like protein
VPKQISGGEVVVASLLANGVNTVFGIPGSHNLSLYDALARNREIQHITVRHEQGAGFMADGYARASGIPGVCVTTTGPAALNVMTSLGTAYADSSPVMLIASQNHSASIGMEKGLIHELSNQLGALRTVTSFATRPVTVGDIARCINTGFESMRSGRPRPVAVEIPLNLLDDTDRVTVNPSRSLSHPSPSEADIDRTSRILASAKKPVLLAGGGVVTSGASLELVSLAEILQAPVFTTVMGKGSIPGDHRLSAGSALVHPASRDYLAECDVLLAIGTRFTDEETDSWNLQLPPQLIQIDIDPSEIERNYKPTLGILGDATEVLRRLNADMENRISPDLDERAAEVGRLQNTIVDDCRQKAPAGVELVDVLRSTLPRDTVVVSDLTLAAYWCRRLLKVFGPRQNIYPWGFGTLGFGLPAAIGAKIAKPDAPVVAICGDGGLMFSIQELSTAVKYDVAVVVLVFNNQSYGVLAKQQQARFGRKIGITLQNPDFLGLARSFGILAERAETLAQLSAALRRAIESESIRLIEVTVPVPWPVMEPSIELFKGQQELIQ